MKLRLLLRRLTISSPRVSVHGALTWPLRVALMALVLGFCAAIAVWAFEFGKDIAGLERGLGSELGRLRVEVVELRKELASVKQERDQAQSVANTAGTLMAAERASQERLQAQVKQLEDETRVLRDDLGFFEKLIPATSVAGVSIRGLKAEFQAPNKLHWQVLVIQANKSAGEFTGTLELSFSGTVDGKPWNSGVTASTQAIKVRQYGRIEGVLDVPDRAVVAKFTARLLEGKIERSVQSVKL